MNDEAKEKLEFVEPNTEELLEEAEKENPLPKELKEFLKNTKYLDDKILNKPFDI